MSTPAKRVVGWYNKQEWEAVYHELYSGDQLLQSHALDRICVWKSRLLHRLSTAIECTWQLVTAQLQDRQEEGSTRRDQELRMSYSIALVRFVNLLTEKGQTKMYAKPVHVLAEELGLPEWLVDMRHEATHSTLPSLIILRTAATVALEWLKREYWETQLCPDNGSEPEYRQDITQVISDFVHAQFKVLQDEEQAVSQKQSKEHVRQVLNELEKAVSQDREKVFQCLTDRGRMVPNTEQLEILNLTESELMTNGQSLSVPDCMVQFWRPVLRLFHHLRITPNFLVHLMKEVKEEGNFRDKMLMGWISAMLESLSTNDEKKKRVRPMLYSSPCDVDDELLVEMAVQTPNRFTPKLLKCLFRMSPERFSAEQRIQLVKLVKCYTQESGVDPADDCVQNTYTVESLCGASNEQGKLEVGEDITKMEVSVTGGSTKGQISQPSWQLATDLIDWSMFPLGMCPNRDNEYNRLELPPSVDNIQLKSSKNDINNIEPSPGNLVDKGLATEIGDQEDLQSRTSNLSDWTKLDISLIQRHVSLL